MSLDQFAKTRGEPLPAAVDFPAQPHDVALAYWRKHPNLHGWMTELYRRKDGADEDFNGCPVEITLADLARLERELDALPLTTGVLFGTSRPEERGLDEQFIERARIAIRAGLSVYYTARW